jgi:hypothetical protein
MTGSLQLALDKVAEIRALLGTDDPELLHDVIEGQTDLFEIMDWLLDKLADEEGMEDAIAARVKSLGDRKGACQNRQQRLRDALLLCMRVSDQKSLRRPEATVSIAQRLPGLHSVDEGVLPYPFKRSETVVKIDRKAILDAIREGQSVPGVTLDNGGVALTVRRR